MLTFQDAVDHLIDYLGGGASDVVLRDCKRAALAAYRELTSAHSWTYLYRLGRIITSPSYSEGTVDFDLTGGSSERLLTLTGGTWPTWAASGWVRVGNTSFRVDSRLSSTTLAISEFTSPAADLDDQAYSLYRDTYDLPEDFVANDVSTSNDNFSCSRYVHPRDWAGASRWSNFEGHPHSYTVTASDTTPGRLAVRFVPAPSPQMTIDYLYKRRPRAMSVFRAYSGTLATTAGSATVTSSGPVFAPQMVGSVIRSYSGSTIGGGHPHSIPPMFESVIKSVTSATVATCFDAASSTVAAAPYCVSDPVEIEYESMTNAFLRGCEHQVSMTRTLKDKPSAWQQYRDALSSARDADSRSMAGRSPGTQAGRNVRLRDMPISFEDQP
jgi:hypothetical protein